MFKAPKHSERDIVMFAYKIIIGGTLNSDYKLNKLLPMVIDLIRHSIPKAKLVCFTDMDETVKSPVLDLASSLGIEIVRYTDLKDWNIVNGRFIMIERYLKQHKNEYDRVLMCDMKDVLIFQDIFATFTKDEIFVAAECKDYTSHGNCLLINHNAWFMDWFDKAFDKDTLSM